MKCITEGKIYLGTFKNYTTSICEKHHEMQMSNKHKNIQLHYSSKKANLMINIFMHGSKYIFNADNGRGFLVHCR